MVKAFPIFYTSSNLPASARFNWSYVLSSADSNTCDLAYSTTKAFYVETNYYSKKVKPLFHRQRRRRLLRHDCENPPMVVDSTYDTAAYSSID
jgi:hypothetical protein